MVKNKVYNCCCIEGAKRYIGDNSIDLIVTDPPYGIGGDNLDKHYNRDESLVVDGYVEISQEDYKQFSIDWINECERILRPGGSLYVVSGYTNLHHILNALHGTNLIEINHIIWKYNFGVHTKNKFVSSHYHILFWQKPGGKSIFNTYCRYGDSERNDDGGSLNYIDREDVFTINREYKPGKVKNKNELPSELLIKLIQYSSNPGDVICDMFLGGFSTVTTAIGLNRNYTGFEISPAAYKMGLERIENTEAGSLLCRLKKPSKNLRVNSGKPWTEAERDKIRKLIEVNKGKSKKDIIECICSDLKRGQWGVLNEINRLGISISSEKEKGKTQTQFKNVIVTNLNEY